MVVMGKTGDDFKSQLRFQDNGARACPPRDVWRDAANTGASSDEVRGSPPEASRFVAPATGRGLSIDCQIGRVAATTKPTLPDQGSGGRQIAVL